MERTIPGRVFAQIYGPSGRVVGGFRRAPAAVDAAARRAYLAAMLDDVAQRLPAELRRGAVEARLYSKVYAVAEVEPQIVSEHAETAIALQ